MATVKTPATTPAFDAAFEKFTLALQAIMDKTFTAPRREIVVDKGGRRYVRVSTHIVGVELSKGAYCFVEKETGNILKPDGYKTPAAGTRGNIYSANPMGCCSPYGVAYFR